MQSFHSQSHFMHDNICFLETRDKEELRKIFYTAVAYTSRKLHIFSYVYNVYNPVVCMWYTLYVTGFFLRIYNNNVISFIRKQNLFRVTKSLGTARAFNTHREQSCRNKIIMDPKYNIVELKIFRMNVTLFK